MTLTTKGKPEHYRCPSCRYQGEFIDGVWHCVNTPCRVVEFKLT